MEAYQEEGQRQQWCEQEGRHEGQGEQQQASRRWEWIQGALLQQQWWWSHAGVLEQGKHLQWQQLRCRHHHYQQQQRQQQHTARALALEQPHVAAALPLATLPVAAQRLPRLPAPHAAALLAAGACLSPAQ